MNSNRTETVCKCLGIRPVKTSKKQKLRMKFLIFLAFVALAQCEEHMRNDPGTSTGTMQMRHQLREKLFRDYDKHNIPDDVKCKIGVSLIRFDVDTDKDILKTDVWMKLLWRDTRLSWDRKATNIDLMRVDIDEIWRPDITLYNSVHLDNMMNCHKTKAIVYSTGHVLFMPPCHLRSHCNMTLREHPREDQHCKLIFGSWVYDKNVMDLEMFDDKKKGVETDFFMGGMMDIKETRVSRNERVYPAMPEKFPDITFDLVLRRNMDNHMGRCMV